MALAVLAIAMAAAITATASNVDNMIYLRDRTLAHWVAMNKVAEVQIAGTWPAEDTIDGTAVMAGREWYWKMVIEETPDPNVRFVDLAVGVSEQSAPLSTLASYLSKPQELNNIGNLGASPGL